MMRRAEYFSQVEATELGMLLTSVAELIVRAP